MAGAGVVGFTRAEPTKGFVTWAITSFGVAYIGLLRAVHRRAAHLAPPGGSATTPIGAFGLRSGTAWILLLLLVVWGYDSGAYLTGRWLGRRRLIDHISPSKTVEGLVGGLLVATLAAGIGAWLMGLEPWHPLVIGPLVGLAAQAGDLAESMSSARPPARSPESWFPGTGGPGPGRFVPVRGAGARRLCAAGGRIRCDRDRRPRIDRIDRAPGARGGRRASRPIRCRALASGHASPEFPPSSPPIRRAGVGS